jgi:hypothetical protein
MPGAVRNPSFALAVGERYRDERAPQVVNPQAKPFRRRLEQLERRARRVADGAVEASIDGVRGRKFPQHANLWLELGRVCQEPLRLLQALQQARALGAVQPNLLMWLARAALAAHDTPAADAAAAELLAFGRRSSLRLWRHARVARTWTRPLDASASSARERCGRASSRHCDRRPRKPEALGAHNVRRPGCSSRPRATDARVFRAVAALPSTARHARRGRSAASFCDFLVGKFRAEAR